MSVKWDYDATASLLRFGRKNGGPWEDGSVPDDGDTEMVVSAPQVAADYAALLARHNALCDAVAWERKAHSAYNDACAEDGYGQLVWATENLTKARAEVDRLIGEGQ